MTVETEAETPPETEREKITATETPCQERYEREPTQR